MFSRTNFGDPSCPRPPPPSPTATDDPTATSTTPPAANASADNDPAVPLAPFTPPPRRRRRIARRELIKHVWGLDPLKYPLCPGQLRPLPVVTKTAEIATLLAALNLPRTHQHPWAHGPTAVTGTVVVDARTGTAFPVDAPPAPLIRSTCAPARGPPVFKNP